MKDHYVAMFRFPTALGLFHVADTYAAAMTQLCEMRYTVEFMHLVLDYTKTSGMLYTNEVLGPSWFISHEGGQSIERRTIGPGMFEHEKHSTPRTEGHPVSHSRVV